MKSKLLLPILFAVVLAVLPVVTFAQLGFDNTDTGGGPDVIDVPLDGGTVFLIAAGVLFGVYRLYRIAKKNLALG